MAVRKRAVERSRYFHKRPRVSSSPYSSSPFFEKSPSSAWGACSSLGSLTSCLSLVTDKEDEPVARHFADCPVFCAEWEQCNNKLSSLDRRLNQCVRHLCERRCFMRAFAPCRDWYALCRAVADDEHLEASSLDGWKCLLVDDQSLLPRTVFLNPATCTQYDTINEALVRVQELSTASQNDAHSTRSSDTFDASRNRDISGCPLPSPTSSPFGLLEELFVDDPWGLLLSTILLNRTTRVQVDAVLYRVLQEWPSCESVIEANVARLAQVIRPLGMNLRRAAGIIRFSKEYITLLEQKSIQTGQDKDQVALSLTRVDVTRLYYCGAYAYSAYRLFIRRDWNHDPADHALVAYAGYQRAISKIETCK